MYVFTWVASYGSAVNVKPRVNVARFGNGYEQRIGIGLNRMPRVWSLVFRNKPTAVATALSDFLEARGAIESFNWTDPNGKPGKFICREWRDEPTSPNHRTITCTFEEVFEA